MAESCNLFMNSLYFIIFTAVLTILLACDYWRANGLRRMNRAVSSELASINPQRRELAETLMHNTAFIGPFTLRELLRLKRLLRRK